jgi:hypothetical protein
MSTSIVPIDEELYAEMGSGPHIHTALMQTYHDERAVLIQHQRQRVREREEGIMQAISQPPGIATHVHKTAREVDEPEDRKDPWPLSDRGGTETSDSGP